jgi:hypothetical protein
MLRPILPQNKNKWRAILAFAIIIWIYVSILIHLEAMVNGEEVMLNLIFAAFLSLLLGAFECFVLSLIRDEFDAPHRFEDGYLEYIKQNRNDG